MNISNQSLPLTEVPGHRPVQQTFMTV